MARGYPAPRVRDEPAPAPLVSAGVCIFCKKRPATVGGYKCATCAAALERPPG